MPNEVVTNGNWESGQEKAARAVAEGLDRLFQRLGPPVSDAADVETQAFENVLLRVCPWAKDLPREEWFRIAEDMLSSASASLDLGLDVQVAATRMLVEMYAWQTTAQAVQDGLLEVLESAEELPDGEPVPPPYVPVYPVHAVICEKAQPRHYGERFRVLEVLGTGDYKLRPLNSGGHVDLVVWEWQDCDKHTYLEWVDDKSRVYGRKAHGKPIRLLTEEELKEMEESGGQ